MEPFRTYKVAIIAPTCFYYQAPLFRALAANERIDLIVYFCSDEGSSGKDVKSVYGNDQNWGVEDQLLDGYRSKLLKNHSPRGSYLKSLTGLANFGVWNELSRERPDAVVIMSWMNPTWWLTFLACLRFKIPVLFMTDANFYAEKLTNTWKSWIKRYFLGKLLFPLTTGFLYAGTANRLLYTSHGVQNEKLVPFAYSWGYQQLIEKSEELRDRRMQLRKKHGVPEDASIVLYCGRLSSEKASMELLKAYQLVSHPKKALVLVGDGSLRSQMQDFIDLHGLESVYFMGFQNRNDLGDFYALADILVLPSNRETWGLVVNEALSFSLPVVVSDQVGAGIDLVIHDQNGYIFPAGEIPALADQISKLLGLSDQDREKMGEKSYSLIKEWSDRDLAVPLGEYLDSIYQAQI
jgi:glycosyltransferase involved in cell wall biosynthesis